MQVVSGISSTDFSANGVHSDAEQPAEKEVNNVAMAALEQQSSEAEPRKELLAKLQKNPIKLALKALKVAFNEIQKDDQLFLINYVNRELGYLYVPEVPKVEQDESLNENCFSELKENKERNSKNLSELRNEEEKYRRKVEDSLEKLQKLKISDITLTAARGNALQIKLAYAEPFVKCREVRSALSKNLEEVSLLKAKLNIQANASLDQLNKLKKEVVKQFGKLCKALQNLEEKIHPEKAPGYFSVRKYITNVPNTLGNSPYNSYSVLADCQVEKAKKTIQEIAKQISERTLSDIKKLVHFEGEECLIYTAIQTITAAATQKDQNRILRFFQLYKSGFYVSKLVNHPLKKYNESNFSRLFEKVVTLCVEERSLFQDKKDYSLQIKRAKESLTREEDQEANLPAADLVKDEYGQLFNMAQQLLLKIDVCEAEIKQLQETINNNLDKHKLELEGSLQNLDETFSALGLKIQHLVDWIWHGNLTYTTMGYSPLGGKQARAVNHPKESDLPFTEHYVSREAEFYKNSHTIQSKDASIVQN